MRGFPKHINTPEDLANCAVLYPAEAAAYVSMIRRESKTWQPSRVLGDGATGITDATNKVVEEADPTTGKKVRLQMVLLDDPNARMVRLGLSIESAEIGELIDEEGGGR